ncbi:MAG: M1 family metallopeptidase [Myxococcota bacterium]
MLTALLLTAPLSFAGPPPPGQLDVFWDHHLAHLHGPRGLPSSPRRGELIKAWDVLHYDIDVRIDPATKTVEGAATIDLQRDNGGDLILHAAVGIEPTIFIKGLSEPYTRSGEELRIPLPDQETLSIDVEWQVTEPGRGIYFDPGITWSFHQPNDARAWLVLYDLPDDKATLSFDISVPTDEHVVSNGELLRVEQDEQWRTWKYIFEQPIPSYLMMVAISDYVIIDDLGTDEIPITAWVYPGTEDNARVAFASTSQMIERFSEMFGPYPWDRYGNASAPFGGAMEHTTATTFGDFLLETPNNAFYAEIINAHEMAHHWWGDDVTPMTWADIWLNEGFASYAEALWYEEQYGDGGLIEYAAYQAASYVESSEARQAFSLYDPVNAFGTTIYMKGACVVHMLRGVLGDAAFFQALRDHEARYRLGNADTAAFEQSVEDSSGRELSWFFDSWVYTGGEPAWSYDVQIRQHASGWQMDVVIEQDRSEFQTITEFAYTTDDGAQLTEIFVEGEKTVETFCLDKQPDDATIDPDMWLVLIDMSPADLDAQPITCGEPIDDEHENGGGGGSDDTSDGSGSAGGCAVAATPATLTTIVMGMILGLRRRQR